MEKAWNITKIILGISLSIYLLMSSIDIFVKLYGYKFYYDSAKEYYEDANDDSVFSGEHSTDNHSYDEDDSESND